MTATRAFGAPRCRAIGCGPQPGAAPAGFAVASIASTRTSGVRSTAATSRAPQRAGTFCRSGRGAVFGAALLPVADIDDIDDFADAGPKQADALIAAVAGT